MIEVDLVAPILLTRASLRHLRANGDGLVVNVTSGIALIALPFHAMQPMQPRRQASPVSEKRRAVN